MKIAIIGSGYVGLCTGIGFCTKGHFVIFADTDKNKVELLNAGKAPFYEKGLDEKIYSCLKDGLFRATTQIEDAVRDADITFIAVGTPSGKEGNIDLTYIEKASEQIGSALKNKKEYHVVVVKSTVVPNTTEAVVIPSLEKMSGKVAGRDFGVCMNPEFLKEGSALNDFLYPDRIVIGEYDKRSGEFLERLYNGFDAPIIKTDLKTAEMVKYASNIFLSAKISLINDIGNICKRIGIDVNKVAEAVGYDKRIAPHFLMAGIGFGGSCFGKDVSAMLDKASGLDYEPRMINSILEVNRDQPLRIVELLRQKTELGGKRIAILGLAFKAETDDIRDAPSIKIINELLKNDCNISAYDPKAMNNMKGVFPGIEYCKDISSALMGASACLILTEWDEFKKLTDADFDIMEQKLIIEGRKVLDPKRVSGFEGVCW